MKKRMMIACLVVTFFVLGAASAAAVENGVIKVGLRYGSSVLDAANLENAVGEGYAFGYFDQSRRFVPLEETGERTITMSPSGWGTIQVTVTGTDQVLYESDGESLGVMPLGFGEEPVTWFKGYRYTGGFEYTLSGGGVQVVNVTDLENYVKGVVPYEMSGNWPLAALEAQAVCARTYACRNSKHLGTYGFDVCSSTDCQVYNGVSLATARSDQAVENTAGLRLYYGGSLVQDAVYHASNGGATEDAKNVWGTDKGYLKGKTDPYESKTSIPNYSWTVTYTAEELTWILDQKLGRNERSIGSVQDVYISAVTPAGNVSAVTFVGSDGVKTVTGETCRTIFYSSTYGKSVKSQRFQINGQGGGGSGGLCVNDPATPLASLDGAAVLSGTGTQTTLRGETASAITSTGVVAITAGGSGPARSSGTGTFTITGTGNGHNVGMSQYGAKAMAELGYSYEEILQFYYTDVTIE